MKEKERLTEDDLNVLEIVDDTWLFSEFIRSQEEAILEGEHGWNFDNYQRKTLTDSGHYLSVCTGRTTGKTEVMQNKIIHYAVSNRYQKASANEILLVVQNKAQLEPTFLRIIQFFRTHPLLKHYIDARTSVNMSNHEIRLLNGAWIRARIVGATADSNVIGLHCPCIFVDEAQVFSYSAWNSLMQVLTTWDTKEVCGADYQLWVSGVPNGLREKNVLYECDQTDDKYSRHNLSREYSPRYTKEQHENDLKQYGGENGDDYVHLVLGEHGSPAFSVFDRKLMKIEDYHVTTGILNNIQLDKHGGRYSEIINAPEVPIEINESKDLICAGIDAGFSSDPTIITILWRHKETRVWREFARYELRRIKYPMQAKIIDWLDSIYRFNMLCLDNGSAGVALAQILADDTGDFGYKDYVQRLVPVDFQANVVVGYEEDPRDPKKTVEIKKRIRQFTIQTLQKWSQNDQLIAFSTDDDDVISELERVGFTRDMLGDPKYFVYSPQGGQKGEDHILASLLTWTYGYYYNYYSPEQPNKKGKYSDLAKGGFNYGR